MASQLPTLFYTTVSSLTEAEALLKTLLEKKCIVCGNVLPGLQSFFMWNEKLDQASEVGVLVKTLSSHSTKLLKILEEEHPYECPVILEIPVTRASEKTQSWMEGLLT